MHCSQYQAKSFFVKLTLDFQRGAQYGGIVPGLLLIMNSESTNDKPTSMGEGLRVARELRKLSLREVEDASGISNAYLSQLENDRVKKPSPHFLHKLAALYDISYELLMESAGYIKRKADADGPKTLQGAALFAQEKLTSEEEVALADYLAFLRSKKK
jgi:HTH-type transcriptional regulator, competence development regulator